MFYLATDIPPTDRDALVVALHGTLSQMFHLPPSARPVVAEGDAYPALSRLAVDLTGASVNPDYRVQKPVGSGSPQPGPTVHRFTVQGHPLRYGDAAVQLDLAAEDVCFQLDCDSRGRQLLMLDAVNRGTIAVELSCRDIESLMLSLAKEPLARHGVTIEEIRVYLSQTGTRSLGARVKVTVKKRVVVRITTVVDIEGRLDVNDELYATVSNLTCQGDGVVGSFVCGLLRPKLERFNGQGMSLLAVPLGNARLRDVQIRTGDSLRVDATIGG